MVNAAATRPEVSVIVPSYNAADTIGKCLTALVTQRTSARYEVIVVDSGGDRTVELVRTQFPQVRLVKARERAYAGGARNLGIAEAAGVILAFTDADCIAALDWIEAVRQAHRAEHPVIGGIIDNANPESFVARAYYFTEFNPWMPGTPGGFVDDIAGCCWTMKRSAFERYGPFIEGTYCSDTVFHWRMAADGLRPYLDPRIRVAHTCPVDWTDCFHHERFHGRCFARVRVSERRLSRSRVMLHAATAPLLSALFLLRASRRVFRSRAPLRHFLPATPLILLAMAGWASGEMSGYVEALRQRPSRK